MGRREKMKGFIYRLGVSIKEAGERAGHKNWFFAGAVIRLGLAVKSSVGKMKLK
jgi:hypothetical protein